LGIRSFGRKTEKGDAGKGGENPHEKMKWFPSCYGEQTNRVRGIIWVRGYLLGWGKLTMKGDRRIYLNKRGEKTERKKPRGELGKKQKSRDNKSPPGKHKRSTQGGVESSTSWGEQRPNKPGKLGRLTK